MDLQEIGLRFDGAWQEISLLCDSRNGFEGNPRQRKVGSGFEGRRSILWMAHKNVESRRRLTTFRTIFIFLFSILEPFLISTFRPGSADGIDRLGYLKHPILAEDSGCKGRIMGGDEPWHAFKLEVKNPSPRLPLKTIFSSKSNPYIMQQHLQVLFHTWVIFLVGRLHCQSGKKGVRVVSRSGCHFGGKVTKEKRRLNFYSKT
ncbi:hypothetical protein CEXT_495991 [Caerostris extrusa]|uniref:Uncharacterized protein n=1 Tax=Caerostris extrusa TaxID=172846 RepID=A0AAV4V5B0_CAEEX|nr:hypothetical protein CEXT_495991 [Caerostris extrusa]